MQPVAIRRVALSDVLAHDRLLFNTNNHYPDGQPPPDYREVLDRTLACNWLPLFHYGYSTLTLDAADLRWMTEAHQVSSQTGKMSHLFDEELQACMEKHEQHFPPGRWFVRSDRVSLKTGQHGAGPYTELRAVLESMVSSRRGHCPFDAADRSCTLYLLPWLELDRDKEFRVFVHQNKVTAISQQYLYSVNDWLNCLSDSDIMQLCYQLLHHFDTNIRDRLLHIGSYVMDIALLPGEGYNFYFIEVNSFGAEYASGSALFHWLNDHDVLTGQAPLQFRYTTA